MELYSEIARLGLTKDEKTALCAYFVKNPAQKEEVITVLTTRAQIKGISRLGGLGGKYYPGLESVSFYEGVGLTVLSHLKENQLLTDCLRNALS
ncbi:8242_t:CDS:2 [Funneliformis geosporum]|nr:8242_t:CDS:2 [Funneliformis geosporum]